MNGVDYTKQLAKEREYYQDQIKRNREATEKRIADTEQRSENIQKKQLNNFIEDKAELESSYQKNLNNVKEKTQEALENKQSNYQKRLNEERDHFHQESSAKSKDFDQRLNDIKSSYDKSLASEKGMNKELNEADKKRYDRNLNEIRKDSDTKLKTYQDKMLGAGADLKDQYNRERSQLVRAHEDHLTASQKDAAKKRMELRDRINDDIKKTKEVHQAEKEHIENYANDRLNTQQKKFQERYDSMARDYSERNEELVEAQQMEARKSNRQHQDKLEGVQRDFNKQLRGFELEKRRRDNGSGEFAEVMDKQQGLNEKVIHEAKIRKLHSNLVEAQRGYQERASTEQDSFNQTLKRENAEAAARMERKMNEMNADKLSTVAHEREKATAQVSNQKNINEIQKLSSDNQLMLERTNANNRLSKLKQNFNDSMKVLEEKHKVALEEVKKTTNEDKAEFMKRVEENRVKEVFAMKREFARMMDSTVNDYEQRIANYQRENEYLKMTMQQKLQVVSEQADKEIESQKKMFEARKISDTRANQLLMDQRESQLKNTISQMNINFQKKIDKMQVENDSKLKLITNDYENKLKELRASTSREMASKDMNHQIEQERIKQAYEDEKARVVATYESQISAMKADHQDKVQQLKEYKRLS